MRLTMAMMFSAALVGATSLAPAPAPATEGNATLIAPPSLLLAVQFYGGGPYHGADWERRHPRREWRRERDERRIEEAARREAWRIEREREERRA